MKITLSAFALAAVLAGTAAAQEVRLNGTVAEVFGSYVVLNTPRGRMLVALPEGGTPPERGDRLEVEGLPDGQMLLDATILPQDQRALRPAAGPDRPGVGRAAPGRAHGEHGPGRGEHGPGRGEHGPGHGGAGPGRGESGPGRGESGRGGPRSDVAPFLRPGTDLPTALTALGLRDVAVHHATAPRGERETFVFGRTANGAWIRARLRDGVLDELRGQALSLAAVAAVLPAGLNATPVLAQFARIDEVAVRPRGEVHLRGTDARGRDIEARFDRTGALDRVERRLDTLSSPTVAEAEARLDALDYREISILHRGPRHIEAIAINPYGERIELRMNDLGIVDRERMLTR